MSSTPPDDVPLAGSYVVDRTSLRVLVVMDNRHGELYLRPPGGGVEITRKPEQVRPADRSETLRGRVAKANMDTEHGCGMTDDPHDEIQLTLNQAVVKGRDGQRDSRQAGVDLDLVEVVLAARARVSRSRSLRALAGFRSWVAFCPAAFALECARTRGGAAAALPGQRGRAGPLTSTSTTLRNCSGCSTTGARPRVRPGRSSLGHACTAIA
ncbi:hypothetical protein P3T37_000744 [Kitasatospora sp. MAA4]|uniref:hypothetical protein n=1 Tax=Kitasatospora sp. MAA4 TaxID=3035093 RepID=UPI00247531C8|nr:hypothetical protein [Kitasatospora sp. MAA4]MDH6131375.1 hypothetical protein [Kitasatospora sp. MAA4]